MVDPPGGVPEWPFLGSAARRAEKCERQRAAFEGLESQAKMSRSLGEFPSGQRGRAVNPLAQPSEVRILSPPFFARSKRAKNVSARQSRAPLIRANVMPTQPPQHCGSGGETFRGRKTRPLERYRGGLDVFTRVGIVPPHTRTLCPVQTSAGSAPRVSRGTTTGIVAPVFM